MDVTATAFIKSDGELFERCAEAMAQGKALGPLEIGRAHV